MNKSIRKLLTGVLVCTSLATVGATAYATTGEYYFFLYKGEKGISDVEMKDDNEQKAYITAAYTGLGADPNDDMYMRVRTEGGLYATDVVRTVIGSYTTPYSVRAGVEGRGYKLYAEYNDASELAAGMAQGRWTP